MTILTTTSNVPRKASADRPLNSRGSFRDLTRSYFTREQHWHFAIEALLFAALAAACAWPMIAAMNALSDLRM